jgi:hypothetical protein
MNIEVVNEAKINPTLLTVNQFSAKHSFVTPGGLRFQIFNAKENGLEKTGAVIRIGRRVLIDEEKYFGWIEGQQNKKEGV